MIIKEIWSQESQSLDPLQNPSPAFKGLLYSEGPCINSSRAQNCSYVLKIIALLHRGISAPFCQSRFYGVNRITQRQHWLFVLLPPNVIIIFHHEQALHKRETSRLHIERWLSLHSTVKSREHDLIHGQSAHSFTDIQHRFNSESVLAFFIFRFFFF